MVFTVVVATMACNGDDTSTGATSSTTGPTTTENTVRAPEDTASSVFEAWTTGDQDSVRRFADPMVAEILARLAPSRAAWDGPTCEGAAGSTYCSWVSPDSTVVLRVANQGATVVEVRVEPPPGGVALWPFTTADEAANTQQGVDDGHSPWQLESDAVAMSYAENILGLDEPEVEQTTSDPLTVHVTDATGAAVDVTLAQPDRPGTGGIWAIVEVRAPGASG